MFFSKNLKNIFIVFLFLFSACNTNTNNNPSSKKILNAHLSAGWYPQDKEFLNKEFNNFFTFCRNNLDVKVDPNSIKAIITPHAGYYFSGLCAASVYQNLFEDKSGFNKNKSIKKVIILAPTHTKAFEGIALPGYTNYKTVLGDIDIDAGSINTLKNNSLFKYIDNTHEAEHAIEIQLPFLQKTIQKFMIVPLIVGQLKDEQFDDAAKQLSKIIDHKTLIVISSDFVHYGSSYGYKPFKEFVLPSIRFVDSMTVQAIIQNSYQKFDYVLQKTMATICGQNAIKILLKIFSDKEWDLQSRLSCYYTSAQIQDAYKVGKGAITINNLLKDLPDQSADNSVSYVGLLFTTQKLDSLQPKDQLTQYEKRSLALLPRKILQNSFKVDDQKIPEHLLFPVQSLGLQQQKGAFVTLNNKKGELKGCIGNIIARKPLFETVARMSKSAAFEDHRFEPLKENELQDLIIDISVITPPHSIKNYKEIVLGRDGIILKKELKDGGFRSAVFLPHVPTGFGWDLNTTLQHLSRKAGLNSDGFKDDCEFEVFHGFEIHE